MDLPYYYNNYNSYNSLLSLARFAIMETEEEERNQGEIGRGRNQEQAVGTSTTRGEIVSRNRHHNRLAPGVGNNGSGNNFGEDYSRQVLPVEERTRRNDIVLRMGSLIMSEDEEDKIDHIARGDGSPPEEIPPSGVSSLFATTLANNDSDDSFLGILNEIMDVINDDDNDLIFDYAEMIFEEGKNKTPRETEQEWAVSRAIA